MQIRSFKVLQITSFNEISIRICKKIIYFKYDNTNREYIKLTNRGARYILITTNHRLQWCRQRMFNMPALLNLKPTYEEELVSPCCGMHLSHVT